MKVKIFQIRLDEKNLQSDQEEFNNFASTVNVKKTSTKLVPGKPGYWSVLTFYTGGRVAPAVGDKISFPADTALTPEENKILSALKQWRYDKANALQLPTYIISSNAELLAVAKTKPQSVNDLIKIRGYGGQKTAKYGEDIIALLNSVA